MPEKIKIQCVTPTRYRFDLIADNRAVIGSSAEYSTREEVIAAIEFLRSNVDDDSLYSTFIGSDEKYYFEFESAQGELILCSLGYSSAAASAEGIKTAKKVTARARLVEVG